MNNELKEILIILQEECAEVIVEVSKCMRFGPDQILQGTDETNMQRLQKEIGDLQAMIELLVDQKVGVSLKDINKAKRKKFQKLKTYSSITINK
jgi:NTP pyrophosphatase (non-canonical NTP hydrolase)